MITLTEPQWYGKERTKPIISVLEICDKADGKKNPIAWLMLERIEKYQSTEDKNEVYDASIKISYELILDKRNPAHWYRAGGHFSGCFCKFNNTVSITSPTIGHGAVFLDLPYLYGQHIGTYLMSEIIAWVKRWPEANLQKISLIEGQAGNENKERRNRFYEQFGIKFEYIDARKEAGRSIEMKSNELIIVDTWKQNISELNPVKFMSDILQDRERSFHDNNSKSNQIAHLQKEKTHAYRHPIKWAIKTIYDKNYYRMIESLVVVSFGLVIWFSYKK